MKATMKQPAKPPKARTWYTIGPACMTTEGQFRALIFQHNETHGWVDRFGAAYGDSRGAANSRAFEIVTKLHACSAVVRA